MKTIGIRTLGLFAAAGVIFLQAQQTNANIIYTDLGINSPPAALGGIYNMGTTLTDGRALGDVNDAPSPLGNIQFSITMSHFEIGSGWLTWSHGYLGDVYWTKDFVNSVVLTLPANTGAFYFYAEPNAFGLSDITATDSDGNFYTRSVDGSSGARGFGFHTDAAAIASITINMAPGSDFAIGEFGIAEAQAASVVPETGATLVCLAIGLFGLGIFQRRIATGNRAMAKQ